MNTPEKSKTAAPSGADETKTGTDAATPPRAAATPPAKAKANAPAKKAPAKPKADPKPEAKPEAAKAEPKPEIRPEAEAKPEAAVSVGRVLMVSSARDGFRRAGRAWSKQETAVPEGDLTPLEVQSIMEEPMLTAYWIGGDRAAISAASETVRAKFVVRANEDGKVELEPVTGGSAENESFFDYTPWGKLEMGIVNPAAADFFTVGREVYLDFMPTD